MFPWHGVLAKYSLRAKGGEEASDAELLGISTLDVRWGRVHLGDAKSAVLWQRVGKGPVDKEKVWCKI